MSPEDRQIMEMGVLDLLRMAFVVLFLLVGCAGLLYIFSVVSGEPVPDRPLNGSVKEICEVPHE